MCFYPITVFPVVEAPQWRKGYIVDICFVIVTWIVFSIGIFLKRRDAKKTRRISYETRELPGIGARGGEMKYL
jgi:hypothetical protein